MAAILRVPWATLDRQVALVLKKMKKYTITQEPLVVQSWFTTQLKQKVSLGDVSYNAKHIRRPEMPKNPQNVAFWDKRR